MTDFNPLIAGPFKLIYTPQVLENMGDKKRAIFQTGLRGHVINTAQFKEYTNVLCISFYFTREGFLEAVKKWPWLLSSNLRYWNEKTTEDWRSDPWVKVP